MSVYRAEHELCFKLYKRLCGLTDVGQKGNYDGDEVRNLEIRVGFVKVRRVMFTLVRITRERINE